MQTRLTVCLSPLLVLRIQDSPYPTGSEYVGIARGASGRLGSGYVGICRHGQDPIRTTPRSNTPNLQDTWRGACCLLIARRPRSTKRAAPPDNNSDLRPLEHRRQHGSEGAHISEKAHTRTAEAKGLSDHGESREVHVRRLMAVAVSTGHRLCRHATSPIRSTCNILYMPIQ